MKVKKSNEASQSAVMMMMMMLSLLAVVMLVAKQDVDTCHDHLIVEQLPQQQKIG